MSDLNDVKAGKYELTAIKWRKVTSKPTEPYDYIQYHRGDVIDLNVEDARRLVKAGAVKPVEEAEKAKNPKAPTIQEVIDSVGDDADKAQELLDAEKAKEKPSPGLVKGLEDVIAKAKASQA